MHITKLFYQFVKHCNYTCQWCSFALSAKELMVTGMLFLLKIKSKTFIKDKMYTDYKANINCAPLWITGC